MVLYKTKLREKKLHLSKLFLTISEFGRFTIDYRLLNKAITPAFPCNQPLQDYHMFHFSTSTPFSSLALTLSMS